MNPGSHEKVARRRSLGDEGVALVLSLFFTFFSLALVLSGTVAMEAANRQTEVIFRLQAQVRQFAEAGLIDAQDWFRRQNTQPVTSFNPVRDETANPPILDTEDPAIGIVREFEISSGIWGRYEVRRFVPNSNPVRSEVSDISTERNTGTSGMVWKLVSRGYLFRLRNGTVPFDQSPNVVLATEVVETEIRRLTLAPPAPAALNSTRGDNVTISGKGRISGDIGTGIAHGSGTGNPSFGDVSGDPPTASLSTYDGSVEAVFGVDVDMLRSLADDRISAPAEFPTPFPKNHIVFAETDLVFDSSRPLNGTGILYVDGNLTIQAGSNSFFTGLVYVTGDLVMSAPSLIHGTVIVTGSSVVTGSTDVAEIVYDGSILNDLMVMIGQYRISTAMHRSDLSGSLK